MKTYEFTLKYHIGDKSLSMDDIDDRLFEAGCGDALIGHNGNGQFSLDFCREANTAWRAVLSAMRCVEKALPEARITEAKPDYVGVSDVASILNVSRQYIQKLIANEVLNLPPVTIVGKSTVYRLAPMIEEFKRSMPSASLSPSVELEELSALNMKINIKRDKQQLKSF